MKFIDIWALDSCTSLTSVVIPGSVIAVGESAFHNCKALTSVVLTESIKYAEKNAFDRCAALNQLLSLAVKRLLVAMHSTNALKHMQKERNKGIW